MNNIFRNASFLIFARGAQSFISLITIMLLSRVLIINEYGMYRQFIFYGELICSLVVMGFPMSGSFFLAKTNQRDQFESIANKILFSLFFLALLAVLLFYSLTNLNFITYNFSSFLFPFLFFLLFRVLNTFFDSPFIVLNKTKELVYINVIIGLITLSVIAVYVWIFREYSIIIYGITSIQIVRFFLFLIIYTKSVRSLPCDNTSNIDVNYRDIIKFSFPLGLTALIGKINLYVDKLFVTYLLPVELFAIYSNGAIELPFIGIITGSITSSLLPAYSKFLSEDKPFEEKVFNVISHWKKSGIIISTILFPLFMVVLIHYKFIVVFLYSETYIASAIIFLIYQLRLPVRALSYGSILMSFEKSHLITINSTISLFFNLIFNYIGFHFLGIKGLAIATVLTVYCMAILQIFQILKVTKISFRELFPLVEFVKIFFISFLIMLPFYAVSKIFPMNYISILLIIMQFIISIIIFKKMEFFPRNIFKRNKIN